MQDLALNSWGGVGHDCAVYQQVTLLLSPAPYPTLGEASLWLPGEVVPALGDLNPCCTDCPTQHPALLFPPQVICCEGNAGFYEVGCVSTPLEGRHWFTSLSSDLPRPDLQLIRVPVSLREVTPALLTIPRTACG